MKHAGLWLLGGAALAVVVYEEFFAGSHVPAGYTSQPITAGSFTLSQTAAPSGQVGFVLPSGGHWTGAIKGGVGSGTGTPIAIASTTAPLLVSGLTLGQAVFMGWTDASGVQQTSAYAVG
jgi:hypothetical protein